MTDFNTFSDIKHTPLRVYNRAVQAFNIWEDSGEFGLKQYAESLTELERVQVFMMVNYIKSSGPDKARAFAMKDYEPEGVEQGVEDE